MTALRELLVYPHGDSFVVIGGNARLKAMKEMGYKEALCKIIPIETTVEQLRAYTIKDNSGFGYWDFELLKEEWGLSLLEDCDIELPEIIVDDSFDKDKSNDINIQFKLEIDCENEETLQQLYEELNERGLVCRILTL